MYADAVYFALKYRTGIGLMAEKIDSGDLARYLTSTFHLHFGDLPDTVMSLCEDRGAWEKETVKAKLFLSLLFHWALLTRRFSGESEDLLFTAFAETSRHYIDAVFKAEMLTEEHINVLPKLFRLGYHSSQVVEAFARKEYAKGLKALNRILAEEKQFAEIAKLYKEKIDNAGRPQTELEICIAKLKENIRFLMRQGEYQKVGLILTEYEKICPGDESIEAIRKELSEKVN